MNTPYDPEFGQPIIPLPEQEETAELQDPQAAIQRLGEIAVGSTELPSAEEIPSLLPELEHIASANQHRYNEENTVYTRMSIARQVPEAKRSKEQQGLVEDVETMKKFAPYASAYEDIYTPAELHSLTVRLRTLGEKNRPDFNGVEARILDVVLSAIQSTELVPSNVRDMARRAEKNAESRRGMQSDTMVKLAGEASRLIAQRPETSYCSDYFIEVRDPEPAKHPDLTKVYQFVADDNALDVAGQRTMAVHETRLDAFVTNCGVVNAWYAEVAPVLARLPRDFKVGRFRAAWQVKSMVESMNARLTGHDSTGRNKDYRMDPAGAIRLQMKIGHTIESIKSILHGDHADETEIVPLDD